MASTETSWSQHLDFLVGTTPIVGYFGILLLVGFGLPRTPLAYGTMLAAALPGTYLVFAVHEYGHYVTAEEHCEFLKVYFTIFKDTLASTLLSFFLALGLLLIDTFEVYPIPEFVFFLGVISPGAVVMSGQSKRPSCSDEAALAGLMLGSLPGLAIWAMTEIGFPAASMELPTLMLSFTMVLSLGLTVFNSLPFPGLDGKHVFTMGDPDTVTPMVLVAALCGYALYTVV